ncbi:hypothetical protein [Mangrovibacterium marinum]|uniref:hypothetical protein n=1 Tax=Mangrovibacterium marinum TaxID=1639118 RepID=UPI002A189EA1|nr:hypothetical protein [Mangrovibacterium marinum]
MPKLLTVSIVAVIKTNVAAREIAYVSGKDGAIKRHNGNITTTPVDHPPPLFSIGFTSLYFR